MRGILKNDFIRGMKIKHKNERKYAFDLSQEQMA